MYRRRDASLLARNPVFRNFLAASTVSLLGSSVFDIAMPLYVLGRTESPVALALVMSALHLPYSLMAPITGYTVDHFDKRKVMLCSDIGQVVAMVFLLVYDFLPFTNLWPVFLGVFVAKTLMNMFETVTTFQLVPALVRPQDLSVANTWFLSSLRFVQFGGPMVGGFLMTFFGVRSCILVNMLSFGATLYFVYRMRNLHQLIQGDDPLERTLGAHREVSLKNVLRNFVDNLKHVLGSPLFRPFIPLMFLWNLSPLIPNTPTLTYYFIVKKQLTAAEYGSIVSLFGVFSMAGYLVASLPYDRMDFYRAFVGSALWQAAFGTLALCFLPIPIAFAVIFGVSRAGSSILNMGTFLIRQTRVPKARMGGVNSCLRMFFMSAAPLSALLQGYLIEHLGVGSCFALGAACLWGVTHYARKVSAVYEPRRTKIRMEDPKMAA